MSLLARNSTTAAPAKAACASATRISALGEASSQRRLRRDIRLTENTWLSRADNSSRSVGRLRRTETLGIAVAAFGIRANYPPEAGRRARPTASRGPE